MKQKKLLIVLFLLPSVLIYSAFFLYPSIRTLLMSFYNIPDIASKTKEWSFVGLSNYEYLKNSSLFMQSMWNILKIWIFGGISIMFLSFLFSVILTSGVKGKNFWKSVIYLPNVIASVAMATMWTQYIYSDKYGLFKNIFKHLGLNGLANIQWLDSDHIFLALMIAFGFGAIGYYMLILISAIDGIPIDFYEAAVLEGANIFQKFFHITLPLLHDVFKTCVILWTITAVNFLIWAQVFVNEAPPQITTPGLYMYLKLFGISKINSAEKLNVGIGAAVGIIITITIIIGTSIVNRLFHRERLEY